MGHLFGRLSLGASPPAPGPRDATWPMLNALPQDLAPLSVPQPTSLPSADSTLAVRRRPFDPTSPRWCLRRSPCPPACTRPRSRRRCLQRSRLSRRTASVTISQTRSSPPRPRGWKAPSTRTQRRTCARSMARRPRGARRCSASSSPNTRRLTAVSTSTLRHRRVRACRRPSPAQRTAAHSRRRRRASLGFRLYTRPLQPSARLTRLRPHRQSTPSRASTRA